MPFAKKAVHETRPIQRHAAKRVNFIREACIAYMKTHHLDVYEQILIEARKRFPGARNRPTLDISFIRGEKP